METKNNVKGWIYLAPSLVLLAIFTFYPLFNTFLIAFKEEYNNVTHDFARIGFDNFVQIFKPNSKFVGSFTNTLIIVFVSVPLSTILAIVISVALNSIKPLQKVFQTVFFLPYVTNAIAIGMVFAVMFNSDFGIVNSFLKSMGFDIVNWLGPSRGVFKTSNFTSMVVLLTYIIWSSLPFKILILLSGLQGIDKQYYQAAQIDSASKFRVFTRITIPMLSPQVAYLLITSFIGAFKEYTSIVAIFGEEAGPVGTPYTMTTVVWYIYECLKSDKLIRGMGFAAAAALVLFVVIMMFTFLNLYISKKKVYY